MWSTRNAVFHGISRSRTLLSLFGCIQFLMAPDILDLRIKETDDCILMWSTRNLVFERWTAYSKCGQRTEQRQRTAYCGSQKYSIPNIPTAAQIQKTWPLLLKKDFLYWHYRMLMGHPISLLAENCIQQYEKLWTFQGLKYKIQNRKSRAKKRKLNDDGKEEGTEEEEMHAIPRFDKTEDHQIMCQQALFIVAEHFSEDTIAFYGSFYAFYADGHEFANMVFPNSPFIMKHISPRNFSSKINPTFFFAESDADRPYHLIIDGVDVESADNFIDAIQIYFASIFVARILKLFIQESFMKVKTNNGSKCSQYSLKYKKVHTHDHACPHREKDFREERFRRRHLKTHTTVALFTCGGSCRSNY